MADPVGKLVAREPSHHGEGLHHRMLKLFAKRQWLAANSDGTPLAVQPINGIMAAIQAAQVTTTPTPEPMVEAAEPSTKKSKAKAVSTTPAAAVVTTPAAAVVTTPAAPAVVAATTTPAAVVAATTTPVAVVATTTTTTIAEPVIVATTTTTTTTTTRTTTKVKTTKTKSSTTTTGTTTTAIPSSSPSSVSSNRSSSSSAKTGIIAAVIVVVVLAIAGIVGFLAYKRYKRRRALREEDAALVGAKGGFKNLRNQGSDDDDGFGSPNHQTEKYDINGPINRNEGNATGGDLYGAMGMAGAGAGAAAVAGAGAAGLGANNNNNVWNPDHQNHHYGQPTPDQLPYGGPVYGNGAQQQGNGGMGGIQNRSMTPSSQGSYPPAPPSATSSTNLLSQQQQQPSSSLPYGVAAAGLGAGALAGAALSSDKNSNNNNNNNNPFGESQGQGNIHTVRAPFDPSLDDELVVYPGDRVQVLMKYDDGWALGINLDSGSPPKKGVFPFDCLGPPIMPAGPPPAGNGRAVSPLAPMQEEEEEEDYEQRQHDENLANQQGLGVSSTYSNNNNNNRVASTILSYAQPLNSNTLPPQLAPLRSDSPLGASFPSSISGAPATVGSPPPPVIQIHDEVGQSSPWMSPPSPKPQPALKTSNMNTNTNNSSFPGGPIPASLIAGASAAGVGSNVYGNNSNGNVTAPRSITPTSSSFAPAGFPTSPSSSSVNNNNNNNDNNPSSTPSNREGDKGKRTSSLIASRDADLFVALGEVLENDNGGQQQQQQQQQQPHHQQQNSQSRGQGNYYEAAGVRGDGNPNYI